MGNSIERCYKVHGYPNDRKGSYNNKKLAANVCVDDEDTNVENYDGKQSVMTNSVQLGCDTQTAPILTAEQYNQLISMLNQDQLSQGSDLHVSSSSAFMAGAHL